MVSLKHAFNSGKADGTDVTLVKPSNWNAEHAFVTAADAVVLGRGVGAGPGSVQEILISAIASLICPPGLVVPYAGNVTTPPSGWLVCDGNNYAGTSYPALFAVIGTTYGAGSAAGQFNTPDLRGRVVAGVDGGAGRLTAPWLGTAALLAAAGGAESESATVALPTLNVAVGNFTAGGTFSAGGYTTGSQSVRVTGQTEQVSGSMGTVGGGPAVGTHQHGFDVTPWTNGENLSVVINSLGATGITNNPAVAANAMTNVQPTIVLNYLIKT